MSRAGGIPAAHGREDVKAPDPIPFTELPDLAVRTLGGSVVHANDELYAVASSRDYDPSARLGDIVAPLMWVNSADDFINLPELGLAEQQVKLIKQGTFVLLPIGPNTHGHGTHTWAIAWKDHLADLLAESGPKSAP